MRIYLSHSTLKCDVAICTEAMAGRVGPCLSGVVSPCPATLLARAQYKANGS